MSVNFTRLRAFNAVVREGSFSAAAALLGVTQPAVTAQIRALEDDHGVKLFERGGQGATPTPLGLDLFAETSDLTRIEEAATEILSASATLATGELRIAAGAPTPVMGLMAEFRRRYPGVRLTTTFGNWNQVCTAVYARHADVAVITEAPQDPNLVIRHHVEQRLVALLPRGHPMAKRKVLSLRQFAEEPVIFRTGQSLTQKTLAARLAELDIVLRPAFVLETREAVIEAVAQGLGIGFMFERATERRDAIVVRPISELPGGYTEDVICLRSQSRRRIVAAFLDLVG